MNLPIQMKIISNLKHRPAIYLKYLNFFFIFLTKSLLEAEERVWSTARENLVLYCREFSLFFPLFQSVCTTSKGKHYLIGEKKPGEK